MIYRIFLSQLRLSSVIRSKHLLRVEQQRHGAVVGERDVHVLPELAGGDFNASGSYRVTNSL